MKLIEAVRIITESGLKPELRYCQAGQSAPERLSLHGVRVWDRIYRDSSRSIIEERDVVVIAKVEGDTISQFAAERFLEDLAHGLAASRAREAEFAAAA